MKTRHHDSVYPMRPDEPHNPFGDFKDCLVLGYRCTIHCERIEDGDSRATDMLGCPMRRDMTAIHVSGMNPYGRRTGPGFIRELCMYRVDWHGALDPPVGLGCRKPEAACIVTWDDTEGPIFDYHQRPEVYNNIVYWSPCDYYISFDGIFYWWDTRHPLMRDGPLTPRKVCAQLDHRNGREEGRYDSFQQPRHIKAVRRLLEGMVGVQNNAPAPDPQMPYHKAVLERVGRWGYKWSGQRIEK